MSTERRIDRILEPVYLAGYAELSLEDLRAKLDECHEIETEVSYVRRLAQARLEILRAERARREGGGTVEDLIAALPKILGGDGPRTPPEHSRLPRHLAPSMDIEWSRGLEHLVADDTLLNLPTISDDELANTLEQLLRFERETSESRRAVHRVIDTLDVEMGSRHKVS